MTVKTPAELKTLYESISFDLQTTYTGPLGQEYAVSGTHLRLWAPTAQRVEVSLYRKGSGGEPIGTLPLERGQQGVWSIYLPGDQHGRYYTYTVTVGGISRQTGDPYARAAGVNGTRSMIVDLARTAPSGWERDVRPVIPPEQRAVWEVSVRDFSQDAASGVRPAWRGKFMAFTQQGTTLHGDGIHPTCLNYLKRLGVKYVQLMPIFDFGSVDEAKPLLRQYNWGYDPTNYNVPEGSYSTDPTRGEVRIRECREMIAALHAAGIGVVMDVVYNHMYRNENPLNDTVPCYFFRQNEDGSFSNGSGCGNEFASERPMARRYMIDSILYWAQEYHIDGFEEQVAGIRPEEEREIHVTFPQQYTPELAGKAAVFRVKAHRIVRRSMPELNDEFARAQGFSDAAALRQAIMSAALQRKEAQARDAYADALVRQVLDGMEVRVPDSMVESQLTGLLQELENRLMSQGASLSDYLQMAGMTEEDLRAHARENALESARYELAMTEIARLEHICVTDEDVERRYQEMSRQFGVPVEHIRQQLPPMQLSHDLKLAYARAVVVDSGVRL